MDTLKASTKFESRNSKQAQNRKSKSPNPNSKIQMPKEIQMSKCPRTSRDLRVHLELLGFGIDLTFELWPLNLFEI
jgi:hypothetical protein